MKGFDMQRSISSFLILTHVIFSCLFLPVALLFLITGACYTMGITGSYITTEKSMPLTTPLQPDLDVCRGMVMSYLKETGMAPPTGSDRLRRIGASFTYEWTGSNRDVLLSTTGNPEQVRLEIKDTTFFRRMVQLHKAKGGRAFKVYAVTFAAALVLVLATGFVVAWLRQSLRKYALISTAAGIVLFSVLLMLS